MDIEEMLAREEIRCLMAEYNMAGDSARAEEFAGVFTEDAELTTTGLELRGRRNIARGIFGAVADAGTDRPRPAFVRHNLTTSKVTFTGDGEARGRTYFVVLTDIGVDHSGIYIDEFRREQGNWKIAKRKVRVEYHAPNGYFNPGE